MTLESLNQQLISAIKSKDLLRVSVLRYLLAGIKNREIELRPENKVVDEEQVIKVLEKQIKQRKDSIESYKMGKRQDLVDKESSELEILEELLSNAR